MNRAPSFILRRIPRRKMWAGPRLRRLFCSPDIFQKHVLSRPLIYIKQFLIRRAII